MKSGATLKGLIAGAALSVVLSSSAMAACAGASFVTAGCFSSYSAFVTYPDDAQSTTINPGYITLQSTAQINATLNLNGASSQINYVTLSFAGTTAPGAPAPGPTPIFTLNLIGSNGAFFAPTVVGSNISTLGYQNVTFFSAVGITAGQNLQFQTSGPVPSYVQLGQITVAAPAPLAGAGLLSFLGMGFAGMMRRGRSLMTSFRAKRRSVELA